MRINLNDPAPRVPDDGRSNSQNTAPSATGSSISELLGQDQAQLSGAHVQVQALAAQASLLPEVRDERVQALRLAINSGNYQPGPEKVAEAIFLHLLTAA